MKLLIVPNVRNPAAISAAQELATWLLTQGVEPALCSADASACSLHDLGIDPASMEEPGLVVALGGDGTILKAVHILGDREVPLLGVNMGRLGFMTGAGPHSMREAVATALSGEARIERRAALRIETFAEGEPPRVDRALNEVFVGRRGSGHVVGLHISVNGDLLQRCRADGVIVATATGSTAYALSAGGPVLAPETGGLLIVPVAPHTLAERAVLTGSSDVVEIEVSDETRSNACVTVDGEEVTCRGGATRVTVARHSHDVLLAKVDDRSFYSAVAQEFLGG